MVKIADPEWILALCTLPVHVYHPGLTCNN